MSGRGWLIGSFKHRVRSVALVAFLVASFTVVAAPPALADLTGITPACTAPPTAPCWTTYPSLADGMTIPAYVIPPSPANDLHRGIVLLHGGFPGQFLKSNFVTENTAQLLVDLGYWVIGPDYRGSSGHGTDLAKDAIGGAEVGDAAAAVGWLRANVGVGPVVVFGGSHGGSISEEMPYMYPDVADGFAASGGTSDYVFEYPYLPVVAQTSLYNYVPVGDPSQQPAKYVARSAADNVGPMDRPVMIEHGGQDLDVLPFNATELYTAMRAAGRQVQLQIYPQAGHGIGVSVVCTCRAFYDWMLDVFAGDTTAPDTTISSGPPATASDGSAAFSLTATEQSSFECSLDGAPFAQCVSYLDDTGPVSMSYSNLPPGPHTFAAQAIDVVGNLDPTPATWSWTVASAVTPSTTIDSGPAASTSSTSATFAFHSPTAGATFECALDAGSFATCSSPATYTGLSVGTHSFRVRAVVGGVSDPAPPSWSWTVTPSAPDTTITSGPSGSVRSTSASISFTSTLLGSTFECALDAAAFAACTSPVSLSGLSQGAHTFQVRAIASSLTDPSPAAVTWTVDTVPPVATITSGPAAAVASLSAAFTFTSNETGSAFSCSVDATAFTACASPKTVTVAEGSHSFRVKATDPAGNISTTASWSWKADLTPPDTMITKYPAASTTSTTATFDFRSTESASTFRCSFDGAAFSTCVHPKSYSGLARTQHVFAVAAVDAAGNVDPTPATFTWTIIGGASGAVELPWLNPAWWTARGGP